MGRNSRQQKLDNTNGRQTDRQEAIASMHNQYLYILAREKQNPSTCVRRSNADQWLADIHATHRAWLLPPGNLSLQDSMIAQLRTLRQKHESAS